MSKVTAANYILFAICGLALACIVIGKISDMLLRRKLPMILFGTVCIVSWMVLVLTDNGKPPVTILAPLLFVLGFSTAAFTLGFAVAKEVNNPKYSGISTSVQNTGGFIGAGLVPILLGRFMDKYGSVMNAQELYSKAFVYCILSVGVGYGALFFIKETGCRNIHSSAKID